MRVKSSVVIFPQSSKKVSRDRQGKSNKRLPSAEENQKNKDSQLCENTLFYQEIYRQRLSKAPVKIDPYPIQYYTPKQLVSNHYNDTLYQEMKGLDTQERIYYLKNLRSSRRCTIIQKNCIKFHLEKLIQKQSKVNRDKQRKQGNTNVYPKEKYYRRMYYEKLGEAIVLKRRDSNFKKYSTL